MSFAKGIERLFIVFQNFNILAIGQIFIAVNDQILNKPSGHIGLLPYNYQDLGRSGGQVVSVLSFILTIRVRILLKSLAFSVKFQF